MKHFLLSAILISSLSAGAQLIPADFENLTLPSESCWVGDNTTASSNFESGSFSFPNLYNAEWGSWAFFGYANFTGNAYPGGYTPEAQTINAVGGGYQSSNYAICYCDFFNPDPVVTLKTPAIVPGMYITNTAWVADAILNGDGMSPAFEQGDYLLLTITGKHTDGTTANVDFYLADYRSENEAEHYYVNDWRYLDLSALGEIESFSSKMTTTKTNDWGATTPLFYAFDNLGAEKDDSGVNETADAPKVKITVSDGVATIACDEFSFEVMASSIDGITTTASSMNGTVVLPLPAKGLNIIRITTSASSTTLKVFN